MVSSVGHLQLSVEILLEIFRVCRKIANSCPTYFFNPRRRWGLHRGPGHRSLHKSQFTSQQLVYLIVTSQTVHYIPAIVNRQRTPIDKLTMWLSISAIYSAA